VRKRRQTKSTGGRPQDPFRPQHSTGQDKVRGRKKAYADQEKMLKGKDGKTSSKIFFKRGGGGHVNMNGGGGLGFFCQGQLNSFSQ